jgi:hypothetical protein
MENRSIAKAQKEGDWELVDQAQGTLRTTLNFRRVPATTSLIVVNLGETGHGCSVSRGQPDMECPLCPWMIANLPAPFPTRPRPFLVVYPRSQNGGTSRA